MKPYVKIILWCIPLLIIVVTIFFGICYFNGKFEPWRLVGNPSENIARIIGANQWQDEIYVSTTSGATYSIQFNPYSHPPIEPPVTWNKVDVNNVVIAPVQDHFWGKITPPPCPFISMQTFDLEASAPEENVDIRFALSKDGSLWYWSLAHNNYEYFFFGCLLVIEIAIYPVALIIKLVVVLIIKIITWIKKKNV